MKRALTLLAGLTLMVALVGCGGDDDDTASGDTTSAEATDAEETAGDETGTSDEDVSSIGEEPGEPDEPPAIDDEELAALAEECFDGSGDACDNLFFRAELGSDVEDYGNTCGGRYDTSPGLCELAIGE